MSPTRFALLVTALLLAGGLSKAPPAGGQADVSALPDAQPTWWHEAAGLTPLLTAPPPPNPATICVIDTGVTPTPDLDITARWAYDGGTLDDVHATDESPGHGTLVAHFAAGKVNGWGGAGAFPHARISSVRVFPREGGASWREYIAAITRCLKLDSNTKVILISLGGQTIDEGEADELEAHIERVRQRYDISVVAAAGNNGDEVDFPGRFGGSFTVGASDDAGEPCSFTPRKSGVDVLAPGCGVLQADWLGRTWAVDGTSFAAPIVAGALAAIRSYDSTKSATDAEMFITAGHDSVPPRLNLYRRPNGSVATAPAAATGAPDVADSPPQSPPPARKRRRLPTPRVLARPRRGGLAVVVRNRPHDAYLEVRGRGVSVRKRANRLRVASSRSVLRCRFVAGPMSSPWTIVRLRP